MERWPSGRRRTPGKCVGGWPSPGFESLSLRHIYLTAFATLKHAAARAVCPVSSSTAYSNLELPHSFPACSSWYCSTCWRIRLFVECRFGWFAKRFVLLACIKTGKGGIIRRPIVQRFKNCIGDPKWIRTTGLKIRNLALYPAELWGQLFLRPNSKF